MTNTNVSSNARKAAVLPEEVGEVIANRNGSHGDPIENHNHIADLWNAYLGVRYDGSASHTALHRPIRGHEVADMMILLKLSRKHVGGMDIDHYRDSIGYAAIGALYVPDYEPEVPEESGPRTSDYPGVTLGMHKAGLSDRQIERVLDGELTPGEALEENKKDFEARPVDPAYEEAYQNLRADDDN